MKGLYRVTLNEKVFVVGDSELTNFHIGLSDEDYLGSPTFSAWGATDWGKEYVTQKSWVSHNIEKGDTILIECLVEDKISPPVEDKKIGPLEKICAFCHKKKSDAVVLIESEYTVCICDECVDRCKELVDVERAKSS